MNFGLIMLTIAVLLLGASSILQARELGHLKKRVACLEHPHGESSITATKLHGKWIVSTPHRTGC